MVIVILFTTFPVPLVLADESSPNGLDADLFDPNLLTPDSSPPDPLSSDPDSFSPDSLSSASSGLAGAPSSAAGSISGFIWADSNANGLFDTGETRLSGYTVFLYAANNSSTPLAQTQTLSNGSYTFDNLAPGNYVVWVAPSVAGGIEYLLPSTITTDNSFISDWRSNPPMAYSPVIAITEGEDVTGVDAGMPVVLGFAPMSIGGWLVIDLSDLMHTMSALPYYEYSGGNSQMPMGNTLTLYGVGSDYDGYEIIQSTESAYHVEIIIDTNVETTVFFNADVWSSITLINNIVLKDGADLTMLLYGDLQITGSIMVPENRTITIDESNGAGRLTVEASYGAGIGGTNAVPNAGTINILGGEVTATGGTNSAGIGGSDTGNGGIINIIGGEVTATGGKDYSAGIGGGSKGDGGVITISGGTVKAYAGGLLDSGHHPYSGGAGIGGGSGGSGGSITINGNAVITMAMGSYGAAGIGGGMNGPSGEILIDGNAIIENATSRISHPGVIRPGGPGIGYGSGNFLPGNITIKSGAVNAFGVSGGAGIGGGSESYGSGYLLSPEVVLGGPTTIMISGGDVRADSGGNIGFTGNIDPVNIYVSGGEGAGNGAGIGGGDGDSGGIIIITGGDVIAIGVLNGAGIGGGRNAGGGTITIEDGKIYSASYNGSGIGGGLNGDGGMITITDGHVTAESRYGAGIGGGAGEGGISNTGGSGGIITITGGYVQSQSSSGGAGIGGGGIGGTTGTEVGGSGGIIVISGGYDIVAVGNRGAGIGGGGAWGNAIKAGDGDHIIINGTAKFTSATSNYGAGIGGGGFINSLDPGVRGAGGNGGNITINGTSIINKTTSTYGAGIGGGYGNLSGGGYGGEITITENATIILADSGDKNGPGGGLPPGYGMSAGIGGGYMANGGNITINGNAFIKKAEGNGGAGIGGGVGGSGGNIIIGGNAIIEMAESLHGGSNTVGGAGIGGGSGALSGNIVIGDNASIGAKGGNGGAGIGGGSGAIGDTGDILISGGIVNAFGGSNGAGIGGGNSGDIHYLISISVSNITISGGIVNASGGSNGAGIGSGNNGRINNTILISNGMVTATGGSNGSGIGGGNNSTGTNAGNGIMINGGTVNANGTEGGAGIGGGRGGTSGNITISYNPEVTARGGGGGAGIGGGGGTGNGGGVRYIIINGGNVTAYGSNFDALNNVGGAGIGGGAGISGNGGSFGTIMINGGTIKAFGGHYGAGIGGGGSRTGSGGIPDHITITNGAVVEATGGSNGSGIGSGFTVSGQSASSIAYTITVSGNANVTATGGDGSSMGIGGSGGSTGFLFTDTSNISIIGNANVIATGGINGAGIGSHFLSPPMLLNMPSFTLDSTATLIAYSGGTGTYPAIHLQNNSTYKGNLGTGYYVNAKLDYPIGAANLTVTHDDIPVFPFVLELPDGYKAFAYSVGASNRTDKISASASADGTPLGDIARVNDSNKSIFSIKELGGYDVNVGDNLGYLDVKLYTHIVTYHANDGSGDIIVQDTGIKTNGTFTTLTFLETGFVRPNFNLTGWTDGNGTRYDVSETVYINSSMILYAEWDARYIVTKHSYDTTDDSQVDTHIGYFHRLQEAVDACGNFTISGSVTESYTITATGNDDDVMEGFGGAVIIPENRVITIRSDENGPYTIRQPNMSRHFVIESNDSYVEGIGFITTNVTLSNIIIEGRGLSNGVGTNGGIELSGSNAELNLEDGATIRNCYTDSDGGAVYVDAGSNFVMDMSNISNNIALGNGGGVYSTGSFDIVNGSNLSNNTAHGDGGGAYIGGTYGFDLRESNIIENTAYENGGGVYFRDNGEYIIRDNSTISYNLAHADGGGVYSSSSFGLRYDSNISNNEAYGNGGGVYIKGGINKDTFYLYDGCNISNNEAGANGGGVYVGGNGRFDVNDGTVSNNEALNGGGVYVSDTSDFRLFNGTVSYNTADENGGGVHVGGTGNFEFYNGTVSNNTADENGGGVHVGNAGNFEFYNGTFRDNKAPYGNGGAIYTENYSALTISATALFENNNASQGINLGFTQAQYSAEFLTIFSPYALNYSVCTAYHPVNN